MAKRKHTAWKGSTDGTPWMQRTLIRCMRVMPLGLVYAFMACVIPFYVLFDGNARRASWNLFRHHLGFSAFRSVAHVFSNMYNMGLVVMDRFAAYAGVRFGMVAPEIDLYDKLVTSGDAFMLLSSHLGNFEQVGYMLPTPRKLNVLVYAGETATVMQNRDRLFRECNIEMVPVKEDLSHIFALNSALSQGQIVAIPADRCHGSSKTLRLPFLGADASFPLGPFTLAVQREVPVLVVFAMKVSRKAYQIILERLPIPEQGNKAQKTEALAAAYVACLEKLVRQYPDQWYNFYDFWA